MHEACPQHPDPAYCTAHMAAWWGAVGPFIWQEHFEHICDDKEPPCPPHNHTLKVVHAYNFGEICLKIFSKVSTDRRIR